MGSPIRNAEQPKEVPAPRPKETSPPSQPNETPHTLPKESNPRKAESPPKATQLSRLRRSRRKLTELIRTQ